MSTSYMTLEIIWALPYDDIVSLLAMQQRGTTDNQNYDRARVARLYYVQKEVILTDRYWVGHPDFLDVMGRATSLESGLRKLQRQFFNCLGFMYAMSNTICMSIGCAMSLLEYRKGLDEKESKAYDIKRLIDIVEEKLIGARSTLIKAGHAVEKAKLKPIYDIWGVNLALNIANEAYLQAAMRYDELHEERRSLEENLSNLTKSGSKYLRSTLEIMNSIGSHLKTSDIARTDAELYNYDRTKMIEHKNTKSLLQEPLLGVGLRVRHLLLSIADMDDDLRFGDKTCIEKIVQHIYEHAQSSDHVVSIAWRALLTAPLSNPFTISGKGFDVIGILHSILDEDYDKMSPVARCFYLYQARLLLRTLPPNKAFYENLATMETKYNCAPLYALSEAFAAALAPVTNGIGVQGGAHALGEIIAAYADQQPTEDEINQRLLKLL